MANSQMNKVLDQLRRAVLLGSEADLTDGQLLDCFVGHREEAALEALVRRHAPMVWGVCRRILRAHHDAEDAFQATFLVLVRRAAAIVPREMVANWLYGVARQTALKARSTAAKRSARERQMSDMPEPEAAPDQDLWSDLQPLLDRELSRLPDKYRSALVLCDLEGKSRKEAARQLDIPEGTLSSRLTTARSRLAKRLARHGLAVSGGALAAILSQQAASAGVPATVLTFTIRTATLVAAGPAAAAGAISAPVAALTEGVLTSMYLSKLKTVALAALLVGVLGTGLGASLLARQTPGTNSQQSTEPKAGDPAKAPPVAVKPPADDDPKSAALQRRIDNLDDRLQSLGDKIGSLTKEIEALRKDLKPSAVPPPPAEKREIQIFPLRELKAEEVAETLEQLFNEWNNAHTRQKSLRIAISPSTNSLIVQGSRVDLETVEAIVSKLEAQGLHKKEDKPDVKEPNPKKKPPGEGP